MCAGKAYKRAFDPGSEPSPGTCSPSVLLVIMQGRADVTAFLKAGVGSLCLPCLVRWGEPTQPVEAEPWPGLPPSGLCSHSPLLLPHLIVFLFLLHALGYVQTCGHPEQFQYPPLARPRSGKEDRGDLGGVRAWQLGRPAQEEPCRNGGGGSHSACRAHPPRWVLHSLLIVFATPRKQIHVGCLCVCVRRSVWVCPCEGCLCMCPYPCLPRWVCTCLWALLCVRGSGVSVYGVIGGCWCMRLCLWVVWIYVAVDTYVGYVGL